MNNTGSFLSRKDTLHGYWPMTTPIRRELFFSKGVSRRRLSVRPELHSLFAHVCLVPSLLRGRRSVPEGASALDTTWVVPGSKTGSYWVTPDDCPTCEPSALYTGQHPFVV